MLNKDNYKNYYCATGSNSELIEIRDFILQNAINFGFDESTAEKIMLAVDEACSNIIRHSYDFDISKEICIGLVENDNEFIVHIFDEGEEFNPIKSESPDMKEYFDKFKRGGLGIHIIKLIMDEISYHPKYLGSERNMLCLKKYLKKSK